MEDSNIDTIGTLLEAQINYTAGNEARGLELLTIGLAQARELGSTSFGYLPKNVLAQLFAKALVAQVETDYVHSLIHEHKLDPVYGREITGNTVPVKIYSMGRFAVTVNSVPLTGKRNSQRKPVELLQAIVALGGRGVCIQRICDCIWPEVEGDAAYQNFTVTLFRLRKLIGNPSISLQDRRVTLENSQCWVDIWELERLMSRFEGLGFHFPLPFGEISESMDRILALYNGSFLGDGEVQAWAISPRERLRSRFIRTLMTVGRAYEQMNNCDAAIDIFQKAIELDPLAEEFHQRLISCLANLGRYAEAITAYRRCERVLASTLRVSPATETLAIYKELQKKQQPDLKIVSGH